MGWPPGLWLGGLRGPSCPSWWDKLGFYWWFFVPLVSLHRDPASPEMLMLFICLGTFAGSLRGARHDLVTVTFAAVIPFLVFYCISCIVSYCILFF